MFARLLRHPVQFILLVVVAAFALYELSVRIFAYTGDAYVMSDVIILSSQIEGPISKLSVQNNASVKAGDPLFDIEPTPYRLQVDESRAALAQAQANLDLAHDEVEVGKANLAAAQAVEVNAGTNLGRAQTLSKEGYTSDANLDVATRDVATAGAAVLVAQAGLAVANQRITVSTANLTSARAALAKAEYDLSKTAVTAPEAGRIAPFTVRQGDYMQPGTEVMAIVTSQRLRVVANMAERHLARIAVGQRAWVTLGSEPWVLHSGRVSGVAAGVARSPDNPRIVPYVEPTTDWVRLPRRFPVEITLDEWPPEQKHFIGADARVLIWF